MWKVAKLLGIAAILFAGLGASSAEANPAQVTDVQQTAPRVVTLTISTPAFTIPTKVDVDLPTGYDADPNRRWPVTYVLAGTMNTYRTFNTFVDGVGLTKDYPSIVVSPNGDSGYWSNWYNAGAFGPPMYEAYVIDQLLPLIDGMFRTVPDRSQRAVLGISMGGYGSMMVAARHPDLFAAAASLSGAVDSNLPANGAVLSASPTFQGADADAIYGPRATQEIRWHGHNPTDLADNLRGLDLQVRSANAVPNPGIGENLLSADSVSCVVEGGVYMASTNFHQALADLNIPHLWKDYGPGCHTAANFTRELADTFEAFKSVLANPPAMPSSFDYGSIETALDVWGWHIDTDPGRALEFLRLTNVNANGLTITGSGATEVTTPPLFRGLGRVDLKGATSAFATPDAAGRIRFGVDLGPADTTQENTLGANPSQRSRPVSFEPQAVLGIGRIRANRRRVNVCASALGANVRVALRAIGPKRASTRSTPVTLGAEASCTKLPWTKRPKRRKAKLTITGADNFGHPVGETRSIHVFGRLKHKRHPKHRRHRRHRSA